MNACTRVLAAASGSAQFNMRATSVSIGHILCTACRQCSLIIIIIAIICCFYSFLKSEDTEMLMASD